MLMLGDCLTVLPGLAASSVDAVVTDPPYELGFMGKHWDASGIACRVELWREVLRVLKPGGHLLAFGGTRTYHRMTCAIEDAGFEIRDSLHWLYGSGFPKSLDVSKALEAAAGATREVIGRVNRGFRSQNREAEGTSISGWVGESSQWTTVTAPSTDAAKQWQGWGTALKPGHEPIVLARKPLQGTVAANVQKWGTGALNIDGCRIALNGERPPSGSGDRRNMVTHAQDRWTKTHVHGGNETPAQGRWPANVLLDGWDEPILSLLDSAPGAVRQFFHGYCRVPAVQCENRNVPQSRQANEVLRPDVLVGIPVQESSRRESSNVRPQAQQGFAQEHEQNKEGRQPDWSTQSAFQGLMDGAGVSDGEHLRSDGRCAGDGQADDSSPRHPRTSTDAGVEYGPPAAAGRGGPPSQRNQDGQSSRKPRTRGRRDSHARALASAQRVAGAPLRERNLEVLACDVPRGWLHYFVDTGRTAPCGAAAELDAQSGDRTNHAGNGKVRRGGEMFGGAARARPQEQKTVPTDSGGASRFFYVAKPSRRERGQGNNHPTVKPVALMRYLVRLVTPRGGLVLDPFTGSGTTGLAAKLEGFEFLGIEQEPEYLAIAEGRIAGAANSDEQLSMFTTAEVL